MIGWLFLGSALFSAVFAPHGTVSWLWLVLWGTAFVVAERRGSASTRNS